MRLTKIKRRIVDVVIMLVSLCIGVIIVFPIFYGFSGAFMSLGEFSQYPPPILPRSFLNFDNFIHVFTHVPMVRFIVNSVIVSVFGTSVRLLLSVMAAYAIVFLDFKGKSFVFFLVLGTMMLPGDTLVVVNFLSIMSLNLLDTYLGITIVHFVSAMQLFLLRQSFRSTPRELRDAALIDGCGNMRFFMNILLPISKPILITLYVQSFVGLWNLYLWPLMVTNTNDMRTVQIGVAMLTTPYGTNYDIVMAGVAIILVPSLLVFILLRRIIVRGMLAGALVG